MVGDDSDLNSGVNPHIRGGLLSKSEVEFNRNLRGDMRIVKFDSEIPVVVIPVGNAEPSKAVDITRGSRIGRDSRGCNLLLAFCVRT